MTRPIRLTLWLAAAIYMALWTTHIFTASAHLQAFSDDSAMVFLLHLIGTPLMGGNHTFINFFSTGWPRNGQFFLNAAALQIAITTGIRNPQILKYIFCAWEYALPGFLYLGLFYTLCKNRKTAWVIFPLIGWAILSVSVDWNPINSTRWAMPIFWAHFLLVLHADKKIHRAPLLAAITLGILMLAGLYESVVGECALALGTGIILYIRERNVTPLLYALAAAPGAIRAAFSLLGDNALAPNAYHGIILPHALSNPYFLLIAAALTGITTLCLIPQRLQLYAAAAIGLLLLFLTSNMLFATLPPPWMETEMKYDYAVLSLVLMGWCGFWRILNLSPQKFAPTAAIFTLLIGSALWLVKIQETQSWQSCRAGYNQARSVETLWADAQLLPQLANRPHLALLNPDTYSRCLWGQYTPWTDLLLAPDGNIIHWSLLSFWQNFTFVEKTGQPTLATNGLALVMPANQPTEVNLPIKTPLYDLSALYQQTGSGTLFPRIRCLPVGESDAYWRHYLSLLNDTQRQRMNVCPRP